MKEQELEKYYEKIFGAEQEELSFAEYVRLLKEEQYFQMLTETFPEENELPKGIHGYLHAIKVMIHSFYLGSYSGCSKKDLRILLYAAKYHDIGRINDFEDIFHGYGSAKWIRQYGNILDTEEKKVACFLVEAHSCPDEMMDRIMEKWELPVKKQYRVLADILKDADALDRFRLHLYALDRRFLRCEISKRMVKAAFVLNHHVLERWLSEQKPKTLYHTSFSDKIQKLKPALNWDMYGENEGQWVFASEHLQTAVKYFLHGEEMEIYSFGCRNKVYALVSEEECVKNILRKDNVWLYAFENENFIPVISNDGRFDGEWISEKSVDLSHDVVCRKIDWKDVKENNIRVLYAPKDYKFYRSLLHQVKANQKKEELLLYLLERKYLMEVDGEHL